MTDEDIVMWGRIIQVANDVRRVLDGKPEEIRLGHWCGPGSILNAYREGDLSFDSAVAALDRLIANARKKAS